MIDIDLLINVIEKVKCLWETSVSHYMDKHCKQKYRLNVRVA